MKKNLLFTLFSCLFSILIYAQQPAKKPSPTPTKPTTTATKKPTTATSAPPKTNLTSPTKAPSTTAKKPTTTKKPTPKAAPKSEKQTESIVKQDSSNVEKKEEVKGEEENLPLAVYKEDTTTKYIRGNLKMGDEYITSSYTPPTLTFLFLNDLHDRKKKELSADDFMSDKINIGDKFYLNQQSLSTKNKNIILEEIEKNSKATFISQFYSNNSNLSNDRVSWDDTTFAIRKEGGSVNQSKLIKSGMTAKLGQSLSGKHLNTSDTLGKTILYALLKKDIPSLTMKVWCDPKATLAKSKEMMSPYDLSQNTDPKKRAVYQELLKQNFILVYGFSNIHEVLENIYGKDSKGRTIVVGTKPTGMYAGDLRAFLYKIEMNPMSINNLASECNTKRIPIRYAYRLYFENFSMGAKYYTVNRTKRVNGTIITVPETVYVSEKDFMQGATQKGVNDILEQLEKQVDEFKMRSGVMQTKPFFAAEIGTKQGVYVDERYDVMRYQRNEEKNELNAIKVATIRMTKVAKNKSNSDNTSPKPQTNNSSKLLAQSGLSGFKLFNDTKPIASGVESIKSTPSLFNQQVKKDSTAKTEIKKEEAIVKRADSLHKWSHFKPITTGGIEKGDFLLQNDDKGISILAGYTYNNLFPAITIGAEAQVNVLFKSKGFPSGIRVGAWLSMITNDYVFPYYSEEDGEDKESSSYFTFYVSKDLYINPIVDISPFIGYESAGGKGGVRIGSQFPVNIYKGRFKLIPSVSLQSLNANGEGMRPAFGVISKYDF